MAQAIGFLLLGSLIAIIFPPFTLPLGFTTLHVQSIDMLFVIAGISYVICAILILAIPRKAFDEAHLYKRRKDDTPVQIGQTIEALWHDLVSGWRIVTSDRMLYFAVMQVSIANVLMLLIGQVAGAFVVDFLDLPTTYMSLILAPAAFGLVGASFLMPSFSQRVGKIRLIITGTNCFMRRFHSVSSEPLVCYYNRSKEWTPFTLVYIVNGITGLCIGRSTIMCQCARTNNHAGTCSRNQPCTRPLIAIYALQRWLNSRASLCWLDRQSHWSQRIDDFYRPFHAAPLWLGGAFHQA